MEDSLLERDKKRKGKEQKAARSSKRRKLDKLVGWGEGSSHQELPDEDRSTSQQEVEVNILREHEISKDIPKESSNIKSYKKSLIATKKTNKIKNQIKNNKTNKINPNLKNKVGYPDGTGKKKYAIPCSEWS